MDIIYGSYSVARHAEASVTLDESEQFDYVPSYYRHRNQSWRVTAVTATTRQIGNDNEYGWSNVVFKVKACNVKKDGTLGARWLSPYDSGIAATDVPEPIRAALLAGIAEQMRESEAR